MGNTPTKEAGSDRRQAAGSSNEPVPPPSTSGRRTSRGDLSLLGIVGSSSASRDRNRRREDAPFVHRETKAEREARKLAREREIRAVERERSMKEENVDGGYLVTLGTYTGTEDYSKPVVRQLLVSNRSCLAVPTLLVTAHILTVSRSRRSSARWLLSGRASMTGLTTGPSINWLLQRAACQSPPPTRYRIPNFSPDLRLSPIRNRRYRT